MRTARRGLSVVASMVLIGAAAQGGTVNTTLSVKGSGSLTGGTSVSATGTVTLSGIGSGTFSSSFSLLSAISSGSAPFTVTVTSGSPTGTLTGNITGSLGLLAEIFAGTPNTSGSATINVTSGTGGFAGTTGTFNVTAAGTGSGTTVTGSGTFTLTGPGTLNIAGATGGGGGGGAVTPSVSQVQNNYSYILPGLPNYGIAPGSLFIVKGSNLASNQTPVLQSLTAPLPTTLNGASISVTVSGTTVTPAMYYTSTGQLAAVLPSTTPVGTGTITVTYNGQPSASAPFTVVASALGIGTYGGGSLALATDANYNLFSLSSSASPGQAIILWGSGVGADTSNDDKTYPMKQNNLTGIPMQVWIGGFQASLAYRGRSQFPGVDQVVVTIPSNVAPGCNVSIVVQSGNVTSNGVTIPVAPGGGTCSDPLTSSISPSQIQALSGKSTVKYGAVFIGQSTNSGKTTSEAAGIFYSIPGSNFASSSVGNSPSIGSCVINSTVISTTITLPTGLNAGAITVTGPGTQVTLQSAPQVPGAYFAQLTSLPANGGAFTFNGSGGSDVGSFNTTVNFPVPLVWTNESSVTTVNRAQGQTVTWSGGAPGTYVSIGGSSSTGTVSVSFTCLAQVSAGQFAIPSWVLLALPPSSNGNLTLGNLTNPQSFTASGLDFAFGYGLSSSNSSPSYQ